MDKGDYYTPVKNYYGSPTSGERIEPVTTKLKTDQTVDRGPFPNSPMLNPYGLAMPQGSYGRSGIFGGPGDMLKSIGTRKLAIDEISRRMGRDPTPQGLTQGLNQYAAQNPYLASMMANYQPVVQSQALIQDQANQAMLNELMQGAYVLGGGIYGGQLKAYADSKGQDKARRAERNAEESAIIGGLMRGLGMNMIGEADIAQGTHGVTGQDW